MLEDMTVIINEVAAGDFADAADAVRLMIEDNN